MQSQSSCILLQVQIKESADWFTEGRQPPPQKKNNWTRVMTELILAVWESWSWVKNRLEAPVPRIPRKWVKTDQPSWIVTMIKWSEVVWFWWQLLMLKVLLCMLCCYVFKLVQRKHFKIKSSFSPAGVIVYRAELYYISLCGVTLDWLPHLGGGFTCSGPVKYWMAVGPWLANW